MSQQTMEAHYLPNRKLADAYGFSGYNCGYAESPGGATFDEHQKSLVWKLLGDTPVGPETVILDVGCGIGGPTAWIFERFRPAALIGVEYCGSSVHAADARWADATNGSRPRFVQGDAHQLPLAGASVDVIFNLESALHYADKRAFLRECRRVLKPGGTLCLGDITTPHTRLFAVLQAINKLPTQFNSNARLWSTEGYLRAFADTGLTLVQHHVVSRQVADSLADGLNEIRARGWKGTKGIRGRYLYLAFLEILLRSGRLRYDLFRLRKV